MCSTCRADWATSSIKSRDAEKSKLFLFLPSRSDADAQSINGSDLQIEKKKQMTVGTISIEKSSRVQNSDWATCVIIYLHYSNLAVWRTKRMSWRRGEGSGVFSCSPPLITIGSLWSIIHRKLRPRCISNRLSDRFRHLTIIIFSLLCSRWDRKRTTAGSMNSLFR